MFPHFVFLKLKPNRKISGTATQRLKSLLTVTLLVEHDSTVIKCCKCLVKVYTKTTVFYSCMMSLFVFLLEWNRNNTRKNMPVLDCLKGKFLQAISYFRWKLEKLPKGAMVPGKWNLVSSNLTALQQCKQDLSSLSSTKIHCKQLLTWTMQQSSTFTYYSYKHGPSLRFPRISKYLLRLWSVLK